MQAAVAIQPAPEPIVYIELWPRAAIECPMCGAIGDWIWAVPWYCGPVATGCSDGGYKATCKRCHDRWSAWDDSLRYSGA